MEIPNDIYLKIVGTVLNDPQIIIIRLAEQ